MSDTDVLEAMVDRHGLSRVLEYLANVCDHKAEHVRTNWQDKHLAEQWEDAAQVVQDASASTAHLQGGKA